MANIVRFRMIVYARFWAIITPKKGKVQGFVDVTIANMTPKKMSLFVNFTFRFLVTLNICMNPKIIKIIASEISTPFLIAEVTRVARR